MKTRLSTLLIGLVILMYTACKKEDMDPQGLQGEQGLNLHYVLLKYYRPLFPICFHGNILLVRVCLLGCPKMPYYAESI